MEEIEPAPEVRDEDVAEVLRGLKPGSLHRAADLHRAYASAMTAAGRPVAHPTVFGKALSRAGCTRKKVRRGRGPRGKQVRTEIHCWLIPGQIDPATDPIVLLVRDMGEGFHTPDEIYRRYLRMGVRFPVSCQTLMSQLGLRGYPETRKRGVVQRYFHLPKERA